LRRAKPRNDPLAGRAGFCDQRHDISSRRTIRMTATGSCIASMAARHVLGELLSAYALPTGRAVDVNAMGGVEAGETVDFVVLVADAIVRLEKAGAVRPGSRIDIARSALAVVVASDAPHPDLGTTAAAKRTLVGARAVAYSTGPRGDHIVGPLAPELQAVTTFAAGIGARSADPHAAAGFAVLLRSTDARDV
jgi:ABC-type molybdate transport system substrate-binding protein